MHVIIKDEITSADNEKWAKCFYNNYQELINYAYRKMPTEVDAEDIVSELLMKILQRKRGYCYINDDKCMHYFRYSLNKNIKQFYAINYHTQIKPLTSGEREYWFEFTREFFDKVLK